MCIMIKLIWYSISSLRYIMIPHESVLQTRLCIIDSSWFIHGASEPAAFISHLHIFTSFHCVVFARMVFLDIFGTSRNAAIGTTQR